MPDATAGRPRRVGLVLARASRVLGEEPYYHEFIEGLERLLIPAGISVLVKVVTDHAAEIATYERWSAEHRVDGVIMVDLSPGDHRVDLVRRLGLPAVVIGDPSTADGLPTVWTDDAGSAREAVRFLADRGHTVIGHVSGPLTLAHTQLRLGGFRAEAAARGIILTSAEGDFSHESGRAATARLLSAGAEVPTAIVYDNDVMALSGLVAITERGLGVPADVSVVAWDDSVQCQLAGPALSAMSHDVGRIGEIAANAILDAMRDISATQVYEAPQAHIVDRDSTGRPPLLSAR
ncbi:ABC transporter substrate-binding protein [Actinoplanes sp. SE50]|uniref:LacI family DNA-binding transcriptional regulator n=1 Tax=unclassified Actinoplanes TaxID=2626549 RepID=UPI00023EBD38|nr:MULTISPECIES: substrate-binding domain-containing protein [unclassified Actinoplanes]AEV84521.1 LacI family transcription regulator [Actinoplanes sp. SE50/110]ATO82913.1 ABC transporter substrate-binding protein [Actinoplanes sp. SE50]SLM00321.1 ABC transporter substrate-binding protein [Actinoplanes sp. SE50/110]